MESQRSCLPCFCEEVTNAEHTEANLLPCNAAARLQARAECDKDMSLLTEFDQRLERIISEFALRIVVPRWTEFDTVWEAAIRVCDRYELGKPKRGAADSDQPSVHAGEGATFSEKPSASDVPVRTHPPVAA
jgi:hypothetical protein